MAKTIVTGDQYKRLVGKLLEIERQLSQKRGYPYPPMALDFALQGIIDGKFDAVAAPPKRIELCRFYEVDSGLNQWNFPEVNGPAAYLGNMLAVSQAQLGGRDMSSEGIASAVSQRGCRLANLADQLDYVQEESGSDSLYVVALGSSLIGPNGKRSFPLAWWTGDRHRLVLAKPNPDYGWADHFHFLLVVVDRQKAIESGIVKP